MLTPVEAGKYLGGDEDPVAVHTLTKWRLRGMGPPYLKLGDAQNAPVRYDADDLDRWLDERRKGGERGGRDAAH